MKLIPIAAESLGTRSMALFLKVKGISIFLDPSSSLGKRFGLLPHEVEIKEQIKALERIKKYGEKAELIFISHYHWDHYLPTFKSIYNQMSFNLREHIYRDKTIIVKDNSKFINKSQKRRSKSLFESIKELNVNLIIGDYKTIEYENIKIRITPPLPHGEDNTKLGYIIGFFVEDEKDRFLYLPDVNGVCSDKVLNTILEYKPTILVIGGFAFYRKFSYSSEIIEKSTNNLKEVVKRVDKVIIDHHILRSLEGLKFLDYLKDYAKKFGNKVYCYADILDEKIKLLEANRKILYGIEDESRDTKTFT